MEEMNEIVIVNTWMREKDERDGARGKKITEILKKVEIQESP